MAIKVIGAGLGRTGTTSLKAALEYLGFDPCYHMLEVLSNPDFAHYWIDLSKGKKVDWDQVFKGYQASVDYPSCLYYKEQMAHYQDAKVILTVRDPEKWYESAMETIFSAGPTLGQMLTMPFVLPFSPRKRKLINVLKMAGGTVKTHFGGNIKDKALTMAKFNEWNEEVKKTVPSEKLLIYEIKQGWEPLCKFLGLPIPNVPFPHVNERAAFKEESKKLFSKEKIKMPKVTA